MENPEGFSQQEADSSVRVQGRQAPSEHVSADQPSSCVSVAGSFVSGRQEVQTPGPDISPEVILADRKMRLIALLATVVFLGAALAGLGALGWRIRRLDQLPPDQLRQAITQLKQIVGGLACLGTIGFLGGAGWLFRLGWKINRTSQYPPPGIPVLWTTRIRRGSEALLRANFALLGAVLLAAAGTLGMVWMYRLAVDVLQTLQPGL